MSQTRKPTVPEVLPLLQAYYRKPGNHDGGLLHVVIDDGNVRDCFVQSALEEARQEGDEDAERLASLLLQMSQTQRRKLGALLDRSL